MLAHHEPNNLQLRGAHYATESLRDKRYFLQIFRPADTSCKTDYLARKAKQVECLLATSKQCVLTEKNILSMYLKLFRLQDLAVHADGT